MKKEEILANCIEEIRNGKSTIEDCVARYPELGNELHSLLKIARLLKPDEVTPSPEFRERARRHLFEEKQPALEKAASRFWSWREMTPVKVFASVLVGILILAVAGGGVVYAAQSSLPGDALYPVKTGVENLQLALTTTTAAKAKLYLNLAERRIDEVIKQVQLNRNFSVRSLEIVTQQYNNALDALSASIDATATNDTLSSLSVTSLNQQLELEQVVSTASQSNQPMLQQIIDVVDRSNIIAQVAYANRELLKQSLSVTDTKLDAGQFSIEGNLISIKDNNWDVGGMMIEHVHFAGQRPAIGSRVKLAGLVKNNNVFISRMDVSENSSEPAELAGQFEGTNPNGMSIISGIPVNINTDSSTQLKQGDKVQLQGNALNNKLNITGKTGSAPKIANITGVLKAVNIAKGTIMVQMTGSQVKVDISQAQIQYQKSNQNTIELSNLRHFIGQDITLEGLSRKSNLLYANLVLVNRGSEYIR